MQPVVSVCIPSYNSEKYIKRTIHSVLIQTFQDFELLIVDDCSADQTLEIAREFKDPRLRVMENVKNLGPEKNWNRALAEAKGEYIKLLHHDDWLFPDCLEKQVEILSNPAHRDVLLVSCSRYIIDEDDHVLFRRKFRRRRGKFPGHQIIRETLRSGRNLIGEPSSVLFRREILNRISGFKESFSYVIDLELWCRMLLYGNIYIIPEPLSAFRVSATSWSFSLKGSQCQDFKALLHRLSKIKDYQLTRYDIALGKIRAEINSFFRLLFYNLAVRRKTAFFRLLSGRKKLKTLHLN